MASAAGIRAGGAYVEIFAKDGAFQQAMGRVQAKMQAVSQTLQRFGTGLSLGGAALGAPLVLAARQAATFQDALLGMQAAAGLTQGQVARLREESLKLSQTMGAAPATIAQAFLELTKAGMTVEDVLNGAGKSAVEFARISGVDAERAAVFMKAAMNVFGVSAEEAVDTLSAAADSSETSIAAMIESFSQVGSAGEAFNQSLFGISQAMAALAKSNIMGEEAGTAIKTMLTKLVAPTDDAKEALGRLGLTVADFRDEMGRLLPMAQIAGVFERALGKMGANAEQLMMSQDALVDVFEQRGIKVITAFANLGEKGFADIANQMKEALPVSEKFALMMSGISGQFERLQSAVNRVSIAFGEAIQGRLVQVTDGLVRLMDGIAALIQKFPGLAVGAAAIAAGMVALGTAAIAGALAIKGIAVVIAMLTSPIGLVVAGIALLAYKMTDGFQNLESWGMRIAAVWKKVGIYLAAAFKREPLDETLRKIREVDAELEKWMAKQAQEREAEKNKQNPKNAAKPDQPRAPMKGDPFARAEAAAELAKQDAELEADTQQAIARTTDEFFRSAKEAEKLGEAGKKLFDGWFAELAKLQQLAERGVLNPEGLQQEADRLKEQFAERMRLIQEQQQAERNMSRPGFSSAGTFGDATLLGIGPELTDPARRTADNTEEIKAAANGLLEQARVAGADLRALVQAGGTAGSPLLTRAADAAANGTRNVTGVQSPVPGLSGGLSTVAEACRATTAATISNGKVLERLLLKIEGVRGAYA